MKAFPDKYHIAFQIMEAIYGKLTIGYYPNSIPYCKIINAHLSLLIWVALPPAWLNFGPFLLLVFGSRGGMMLLGQDTHGHNVIIAVGSIFTTLTVWKFYHP
jgi:hypothetical protein